MGCGGREFPEGKQGPGNWDVHKILIVMGNSWHEVFGKRLGFDEKNLVFELRNVRNRWAHPGKIQ